MCCAAQNSNDEEGKRHGGNALPRMRRLQRSGSISFTQRQVQELHIMACSKQLSCSGMSGLQAAHTIRKGSLLLNADPASPSAGQLVQARGPLTLLGDVPLE